MVNIAIQEKAQRLVIYIGEADHWGGKPLYAALLDTLKAHGMAGATVTRGVAGFGAHSRIHTAAILRLSEDLPLRIEVIDSPDKIAQALEIVAPMVTEGLITIDDVQVVKYTHRYLHPLPVDRPVSDFMTRDVMTFPSDLPIAAAWEQMLKSLLKAAPVVDAGGQVVGVLTDQDLLTRAGLGQRLAVAERLDEHLVEEELQRLGASPLKVADIMSKPAITVRAKEPLGLAAARMTNEGIKRLPIVDDQGKLVGVLSRSDVLRQVTEATPKDWQPQIAGKAARMVREVMSPEIPMVRFDANLTDIVNALVEAGTHRLIVVGEDGKPIGLISDADVVSRIQAPHRRSVLDALRGTSPAPSSDVTARDLMSPEVLTVSPETSVIEAIKMMLSAERKWMVAVDEQGRPTGLVDREAVLRAVS